MKIEIVEVISLKADNIKRKRCYNQKSTKRGLKETP